MSGAKVSAAEAARLAGVSARTMSRHLAAGKVPGAERVGGGWQVPVEGLAAVAEANGYTLRTGADPAPDPAAEVTVWRERALVAEARVTGLTGRVEDLRRALDHAEARLALPPAPQDVAEVSAVAPVSSPVASPVTDRGGRLRGWWRRP